MTWLPPTPRVTTVEQVSVVAGPALGAVLVAVFSPELAFFCNALTFLVAAAIPEVGDALGEWACPFEGDGISRSRCRLALCDGDVAASWAAPGSSDTATTSVRPATSIW